MKAYEIVGAGFDASDDITDDRVFWVRAPSEQEVFLAIADTNAVFCGDIERTVLFDDTDIDFTLPGDTQAFHDVLLGCGEAEILRKKTGLLACRRLPDGSFAGLQRLVTTTSVVLGIDEFFWRYRFCYTDPDDARNQYLLLQSEEDVPDGWVACRPEVRISDERGVGRYPTPAELIELRKSRR